MNSQRGEINEMREHRNENTGYRVGRVKTVAGKRTKRKGAKKQSCRCDLHLSHESIESKCASKQEIKSSISIHAIFMLLNPPLLALFQVHYQVQKVSPFQTHPANVWGFLAGTCLYYFALELKMKINTRSESYSRILGHVLLISGAFSSFSLVSIFLPDSPVWLPFITWTILPFMIARPLLVHVCHWLFQVILKVTLHVGNFFGRLMGSITVQQQQLPN